MTDEVQYVAAVRVDEDDKLLGAGERCRLVHLVVVKD